MRIRLSVLFFLIVILNSQNTFSQKADKLILKFAPLSLMDPYGENIHLGSEFISKGPLSFETDFATYILIFDRDNELPRIKDRIGIKIKPEIRYYLNSRKPKSVFYKGFYIANELYLISDKFKRGDTYIHYDHALDTNYLYHDYEKIKRFIIGDNFKIGYQSVTKIKLTFDYYFGLGLKYYNGSYDYEITDPICCPVMRLFEIPVYKGIRPNITFGIKLGYAL
ncbi:MAG: hypothetical protein K0B37_17465 [Bacteroidales bacterium]|nr:hypothetical protein [Bacteroidales bacterium]